MWDTIERFPKIAPTCSHLHAFIVTHLFKTTWQNLHWHGSTQILPIWDDSEEENSERIEKSENNLNKKTSKILSTQTAFEGRSLVHRTWNCCTLQSSQETIDARISSVNSERAVLRQKQEKPTGRKKSARKQPGISPLPMSVSNLCIRLTSAGILTWNWTNRVDIEGREAYQWHQKLTSQ